MQTSSAVPVTSEANQAEAVTPVVAAPAVTTPTVAVPKKKNHTLMIVLIIVGVLVVISIIATVLIIGGLTYTATQGIKLDQQLSSDADLRTGVSLIVSQLATYYSDNNKWPATLEEAGIKTTINGVPVTYTLDPVKIFIVSVKLSDGSTYSLSAIGNDTPTP